MATNASALLGALVTSSGEREHGIARAVVTWRLLTVLLVAVLAVIYGFAIRQLWIDWQTAQADSWDSFLVWLLAPLQFAGTLVRLQLYASTAARQSHLRPRVGALRSALLAGDERIAPLAASQPEPLGRDESPGLERVGPLRPLRDTRLTTGDILAVFALVLSLIAGAVAAIFLIFALTADAAGSPPLWLGLALGAAALVCLIAGVWQLVRSARAGRAQDLEADDAGLRWPRATRRPRQQPVAWMEARAFYIVAYRAGTSIWNGRRVYLLDTGQQVIAWDVGDSLDERGRAASIRLARLIVTHTHLPLRDLTAAFQEATETETPASGATRRAVRAARPAYVTTASASGPMLAAAAQRSAVAIAAVPSFDMPDTPTMPDTPVRQVLAAAGLSPTLPQTSLRGGCLAMLAVLLAFALLLPAAWGLQRYQASYLAGLPAQIHAEKPLFADPLSAYDIKWYIGEPTATNPNAYRYQDQSYRLSGITGDFVNSWALDSYSDVAVEVTAHEIGGVENDGVGLVLRVDDAGDEFVAFYVSPTDGSWWLMRYHAVDNHPEKNWRFLAGDTSDAIQRGPGAANTLLAIQRGGTYVLYANGRFLGAFSDGQGFTGTHVTTHHSGHMGVYLNDGAVTGVYTSFAVYPVQPPSSLRYV